MAKRVWDTSTTNGKIRVMQSAECGQPLQRRTLLVDDSPWQDTKPGTWDWLNNDFRIRPEPREFCLFAGPDGIGQWAIWHEGLKGCGIRVREILP